MLSTRGGSIGTRRCSYKPQSAQSNVAGGRGGASVGTAVGGSSLCLFKVTKALFYCRFHTWHVGMCQPGRALPRCPGTRPHLDHRTQGARGVAAPLLEGEARPWHDPRLPWGSTAPLVAESAQASSSFCGRENVLPSKFDRGVEVLAQSNAVPDGVTAGVPSAQSSEGDTLERTCGQARGAGALWRW